MMSAGHSANEVPFALKTHRLAHTDAILTNALEAWSFDESIIGSWLVELRLHLAARTRNGCSSRFALPLLPQQGRRGQGDDGRS